MRRLAKKIVASALALTLTVGMCSTAFGAAWGSYFGYPDWYEAAEGKLSAQSATGWTAEMNMVGWGGCWGAQIYQDNNKDTAKISIVKGKKYTLSFTASSSNCNKYMYIKISTGETLAFNDWVLLKKGQNVKYSKTFTAKNNATAIYFALGGDFGDRIGSDKDAEARYAALPGYENLLPDDAGGNPTTATVVKMSNYKLGPATNAKLAKVKIKKVKAAKGGAVVTYKKVKNAAGYQVKYKAGKKTVTKDAKKKLKFKIKKVKSESKIRITN